MLWLLCLNIIFYEMYLCCLQLSFLHCPESRVTLLWNVAPFFILTVDGLFRYLELLWRVLQCTVPSHMFACFSAGYLPHESCSASLGPAKRFSVLTPFPCIYSWSSHINPLMKASHPLRTDKKTKAQTQLCQFLRATEPVWAEQGHELGPAWLLCQAETVAASPVSWPRLEKLTVLLRFLGTF